MNGPNGSRGGDLAGLVIPPRWRSTRLRALLRLNTERRRPDLPLLSVVRDRGVIQRDTSNRDENFNYIPDDLNNYKVVRPGQFAMNKMKAWQGSYGVSPFHGLVSPAYHVFDLRRGVLPDFFHRAIRSAAYVPCFARASDGVRIGQWDLNLGRMKGIPFLVPPDEEQAAIVRLLDHVDRRIRRYIQAKKKLIALLNEQKQAIIHRAVTRGLDPNVPLKPSGVEWLEDVPEHWEVRRLARLTDPTRPIMYGIVLPGPNVGDGVPIVKGGNCEPGRLRLDLLSRTTREIEARYERSRLRGGDIVIAIRGGVGATDTVPTELEGANLTQDAARIAPAADVHPAWLLSALRSPAFLEHVNARVLGATVRGINIRDLRRIELPVPPIAQQVPIADHVTRENATLEVTIMKARREISLLQEYRTRLITDVVTGKLDVRDAAARFPEEPLADDDEAVAEDLAGEEDDPEAGADEILEEAIG